MKTFFPGIGAADPKSARMPKTRGNVKMKNMAVKEIMAFILELNFWMKRMDLAFFLLVIVPGGLDACESIGVSLSGRPTAGSVNFNGLGADGSAGDKLLLGVGSDLAAELVSLSERDAFFLSLANFRNRKVV